MPIDNDGHVADVWMGSGDIAVGGRLIESGEDVYVAALEFSVLPDTQPVGSVCASAPSPGARLVFTSPEALDVVVETLRALRAFWRDAEVGLAVVWDRAGASE